VTPKRTECLLRSNHAQFSVQWTGEYAPRFLSFFVALGFLRFDGESRPAPPVPL
jgi:hypothetical protein